jgi:hypothetical protein
MKLTVLGEEPVPVLLCPPQIPHGPTRDRTRVSAVRGRRLTAWAMARPRDMVDGELGPSCLEVIMAYFGPDSRKCSVVVYKSKEKPELEITLQIFSILQLLMSTLRPWKAKKMDKNFRLIYGSALLCFAIKNLLPMKYVNTLRNLRWLL